MVSSSDAQSVINNKQLQRLNTDGSLDASFQLDASILADTVQRDVSSGIITNMAVGNKILMVAADGTILFQLSCFRQHLSARPLDLHWARSMRHFLPHRFQRLTTSFQASTTSDGLVPALSALSPGLHRRATDHRKSNRG